MSSNDAATIGLETSSNAAEQEEVDRWKIQIKENLNENHQCRTGRSG